MQMPLMIALILFLLCEGTGRCLYRILRIQSDEFGAPIGAVTVFALLETLYFPCLLHQGSFNWIKLMTIIMFIIVIVISIWNLKDTFKSLWRFQTLFIVLSGFLLAALYLLTASRFDFHADQELMLMAGNVKNGHMNLGNLSLQGYEAFGSYISWMFNGNMEKTSFMLGLFENLVASAFAVNVVQSFSLKNKVLKYAMIVFSIFYSQFYGWKIMGSHHGGSWRILLLPLLMYQLYQWVKREDRDALKFFVPVIIAAGLFTNNSFLMLGIDILYCTAVYLFHIKKIRSLYDLTTFSIPLCVYGLAVLSQYSRRTGWFFSLAYFLFMLSRRSKKIYSYIISVENFLIDHARKIFLVSIPVIFLAGSFIMRFFTQNYGVEYSYYIHFFSSRPIRNYLFIHASLLDVVVDLFRWLGFFIFIWKAEKSEDHLIRYIFMFMIIFFINPLCMGMLAEVVGMEMYAYAFEIIFNGFTDILLFVYVAKQFEDRKIVVIMLEITLFISVLLGHIASFAQMKTGLYTELIDKEKIREVVKP